MVYSTIQHPPPSPPQTHTIYIVRRVSAKIPRAWAVRYKGVHEKMKLLVSRQFTRPKSVRADTLENDRCKQV